MNQDKSSLFQAKLNQVNSSRVYYKSGQVNQVKNVIVPNLQCCVESSDKRTSWGTSSISAKWLGSSNKKRKNYAICYQKTSIKTHPMKREPPPVLPNLPKVVPILPLSLVPRPFCDTTPQQLLDHEKRLLSHRILYSSATSWLWEKALVPQAGHHGEPLLVLPGYSEALVKRERLCYLPNNKKTSI